MLEYVSTNEDGNLSLYTLSTDEAVKNRMKLATKLNFDVNKLRFMYQTHGDEVVVVDENSLFEIKDTDALITNTKNLPIMVTVADCIPVCIKDKTKQVIAVVHSGREGSFKGIIVKTLQKMQNEFGCNIDDLEINFGASIGKCCYEVGDEILNKIDTKYIYGRNIDLISLNVDNLLKFGVLKQNITIDTTCTKCGDGYFSHRNQNKERFCAIMMIE